MFSKNVENFRRKNYIIPMFSVKKPPIEAFSPGFCGKIENGKV